MANVEILTGAERQRRWSAEQKLSILQEAFGTDGSVSVVARRHDILGSVLSGEGS
ncbi:transposase [Sinorhizobium meliloti]|nr:transposase [Sinorhizobium meliloti]MDW9850761.1 transposase [Sinorhizobium meliloti]MDX0147588.1 transposase [Sinorhizobium meliloti]MDX0153875.1 transposase [Sinorhizobium meliloti]MDX0172770.1 transposase [Sinorhizobium meliloti]